MNTFPVLTIKKGKERSLINRHPWVFSGAVTASPDYADGCIVAVRSADDKLFGFGFYSPASQIICRIFAYSRTENLPTETDFWFNKLAACLDLRRKTVTGPQTDAYRLVNAEGDFFPGLIADVYGDTVVLQTVVKGTSLVLTEISEALKRLGFKHIYLKTKEVSKRIEGVETSGWLGEAGRNPVVFRENDLLFRADLLAGQKTGFFLDQRDSRKLAGEYAAGRRVLNTFSYSGGFSLYALRSGAELVDSVDSSQSATDLCTENVRLNKLDESRHRAICAECFSYLKDTEEKYDMIILDPPAFAKSAKAVKNASRGYKDLNMRAMRKIMPGGILFTFSCSRKITKELFRKIIFSAAADVGRNVRILHQTDQPADHPINIFHPDNDYLKGLLLYVE